MLGNVVATAPAMRALMHDLSRLIEAKSPVLLQGESGTGKDLIAHVIHYSGSRRDAPFIRVHCPSIPEELLESELFGHEKGAFTDARHAKLGKIELAAGGTVYFDQIHDLQPQLQAKLLRVVEERRFERLGGTRTLEIDVRVLASSGADPEAAVKNGSLRADLYHRLSVVPLILPPLRTRREDIAPLLELFLARERQRGATRATRFSVEALAALQSYNWPGNVRELRAAVERAALLVDELVLSLPALPPAILANPLTLWEGRPRLQTLKAVEQAYIRHVLEHAHGNQSRAAEALGISRKALWEKRRRFGIP